MFLLMVRKDFKSFNTELRQLELLQSSGQAIGGGGLTTTTNSSPKHQQKATTMSFGAGGLSKKGRGSRSPSQTTANASSVLQSNQARSSAVA
jgi:hypothetical protein